MTDLRAAQQALEALEAMNPYPASKEEQRAGAITALRAALAEPVQEPVAIVGTQADVWRGYDGKWAPPGPPIKTVHMLRDLPIGAVLYAAPPQRPAEPVQEPVGVVTSMVKGGVTWHQWPSDLPDGTPLYTAPPQRKPLSVTDLQDALVYTNLIDRDAIDDPEGYDEGSTLAQIDALHRLLFKSPAERKEDV